MSGTVDIGIQVKLLNNTVQAGLGGVTKELNNIGESARSAAERMKFLQEAVVGIALGKIAELGRQIVDVADKVQNAEVRMVRWTGSFQAAQTVLTDLNKTLGASGIDIDTLGNAFIKLRSVGLTTGQAMETVTNAVSALNSVGGDDIETKLNNVATAMTRLAGKGFITSRDLQTVIQQTGVTAQEMADAMKVSLDQFYINLGNRMVGATAFIDAFNKAAKAKFGGFVELLGTTIGGAINKLKTDYQLGIGSLGSETSLNTHIVAFIDNLREAMDKFFASIDSAKIDKFFDTLNDIATIGSDAGKVLTTLGATAIEIFSQSMKFLAALPPEALEWGLFGYVFVGKKAAVVLGILGSMKGAYQDFGNWMQSHGLVGADRDPQDIIMESMGKHGKSFGAADSTSALAKSIPLPAGGPAVFKWFGSPDQLKEIGKGYDELQHKLVNTKVGPTPVPFNAALDNATRSAVTQYENAISEVSGKLQKQGFQTVGNETEAAFQQVRDTTTQWIVQLQEALKVLEDQNLPIKDRQGKIQAILDLEGKVVVSEAAQISNMREINRLKQLELDMQHQLEAMQLREEDRQLKLNNNKVGNGLAAAFGGTQAGQLQEQVEQQRAQLQQSIQQHQLDEQKLNDQIYSMRGDPTKSGEIQNLQNLENIHKQIIADSEETLQHLSVESQLQTQFWGQLGQTIETDVGSAISGLIQGTMTWADAGRRLFGDMIDLAIKYLEQLIEVQLFSKIFAASSLATIAPIALAMQELWAPAAISASIASYGAADLAGVAGYQTALTTSIVPFAKGGIPGVGDLSGSVLTGPTLFGIGGEAGDEAVMPLTRIGGKLGVRSAGGGGNNYNITIQAIDTQTGMQFIGQNIQHIEAGLNHQQSLNSGGNRGRRK